MQIGLVHNCLEPGQFTQISVVLIRYSCGHISGHHEPIHVKFGVWIFFIMFYWNMVMKMLKCKKEHLMTSHFSTLYYVNIVYQYCICMPWLLYRRHSISPCILKINHLSVKSSVLLQMCHLSSVALAQWCLEIGNWSMAEMPCIIKTHFNDYFDVMCYVQIRYNGWHHRSS